MKFMANPAERVPEQPRDASKALHDFTTALGEGKYTVDPDTAKAAIEALTKHAISDKALAEKVVENEADKEVKAIESFHFSKQYEDAVNVLKAFGVDGDDLPSLEQIQHAFKGKEEAIRSLQRPILVLLPNIGFDQQIRALNAKKLMPHDIYVSERLYGEMNIYANNYPTEWKPCIMDGAPTVNTVPPDSTDEALSQRVYAHQQRHLSGMKGMDRKKYVTLLMHSLHFGIPLDKKTNTILDDEVTERHMIPTAGWYGPRVLFMYEHPSVPRENIRFRCSVEGDAYLHRKTIKK